MSYVWFFSLLLFIALQRSTSTALQFGPFGNSEKARLVVSEQQNLSDGTSKAKQVLDLSGKGKHDSASSAALAAVEHLRAASLDAAALEKLGDRNASYRQALEVQFAAKLSEIASEQRNLAVKAAQMVKAVKLAHAKAEAKAHKAPAQKVHEATDVNLQEDAIEPDGSISVDGVQSDVDRVFWPKDPQKYLNSLTSAASKNLRKKKWVKMHKAKKNFSAPDGGSTTVPVLPFKSGDIIIAVEAYPMSQPSKFFYGRHEESQVEGWFPAALVEEYVPY